MRTWRDVATLVKTRGLNGRFVARPAASLPFVLEEGMQVAFVPPQTDCPRRGVVSSVAERDDGSYEVSFDSVTDEDVARCLVGSHCLVRRSDIEDVDGDEPAEAWVGWSVLDASGALIGEITGFEDNPAHLLMEVERPDNAGSALIPVVDEFIVQVDDDARTVVTELPAGLLDL